MSAPVGARMRAPVSLARDCRHRDGAEQRRRQALDDEVASLRKRFSRNDGNPVTRRRQIAPCLFLIAYGYGGENQARHTGVDAARHFKPDGAKPGQPNLERLSPHGGFPTL
jgi:hypothetical protein